MVYKLLSILLFYPIEITHSIWEDFEWKMHGVKTQYNMQMLHIFLQNLILVVLNIKTTTYKYCRKKEVTK